MFLSVNAKANVLDYGPYQYDIQHALYWLDLTATANMSYDTVFNRITNPNDVLWGWSYATGAQFEDLMEAYGATPMCDDCSIHYFGWWEGNNGVVADVLCDFGILGDYPKYFYSYGILADHYTSNGSYYHYWARLYNADDVLNAGQIYTHRTEHTVDYANMEAGSFLIRTDLPSVPLPPALWLLGSGLIGILGVRRKLKK